MYFHGVADGDGISHNTGAVVSLHVTIRWGHVVQAQQAVQGEDKLEPGRVTGRKTDT